MVRNEANKMMALNNWMVEHWGTIVNIFVWGVTIFMVLVLGYLLYKIYKMRFKSIDVVGLVLSVGWLLIIIFFGFDHVRLLLQGILYYDPIVL
jgi:hypothetical protein